MKFRRQSTQEVAVNLTPLIDVVFLLLIFFMVSTSFTRETEILIDLPQADGPSRDDVPRAVEVLVDEAGVYRVNGAPLADQRLRTLQAAIYKVAAGDTSLPLLISADAQAAHEDVVRAMDAAGQMGFSQLSISTRSRDTQEAGDG